MDLITIYKQKRLKQQTTDNESSDANSVERTVDIWESKKAGKQANGKAGKQESGKASKRLVQTPTDAPGERAVALPRLEGLPQKATDDLKPDSDALSSIVLPQPLSPLPIDAPPRRLLLNDDYVEIFQEVLRCEYLCRQRHLQYDRKVYLGDYNLHKRKEFLLDYLYSLSVCLEDSIQERIAIQG